MSLFGSIQNAGNALNAAQIGLQVIGQNIANANTPGYIREDVNLTPAASQRIGGLLLGLGVRVEGVVQKIDNLLEQRLRGATSDRASAEAQEQNFEQLEGLIGQLGDSSLSTSLNNFFSSINEILNQPESVSVRNLAVLKGQTLARDFNSLAKRVGDLRVDVNKRITASVEDINRLTSQIADLNVKIAAAEGGEISNSDAVGLRDQRHSALLELSELIDIRAEEQPNGSVSVYTGGDFLVFDGQQRLVEGQLRTDRGIAITDILIAGFNSPVQYTSGAIAGLVNARDQILGGFTDNLDSFASTLAFEFNKVYASGQGLNGYQQITSQFSVNDPDSALDVAGLPFTPVNGSFQVQVFNRKTGLTKSTDITVDLNGLDQDTSLTDLANQLNAIGGISATITSDGRLSLRTSSTDQELAFSNDSSGLLAAMGINTFFSGTSALGLGVHEDVVADPSKFAASRGGIGEDTDTAIDLAAFMDRPIDSQSGASLSVLYDRLTSQVTQGSAEAHSVAEGYRTYEAQLQGQSSAVSGVNLDEEAIKLMSFQRAYQASAKYIATLNDLLDTLMSL